MDEIGGIHGMSFDDIFEQIDQVLENPIENRTNRKTQYVAFVLDMSSSMRSIEKVAIDSYNEQLSKLKEESDDEIDTKVITTVFNSFPVNMDRVSVVPLDEVEEMTDEIYRPAGMTALFDAIGFTVDKVLQEYKDDRDDTAVLFIVITDGQENDSKEFTQQGIKKITEDLEKTERWTFTYMGANVNPLETAVRDMSYQLSNTLSWQADAVGMRRMSDEANKGIKNYFDGRKVGMTMTSNFFGTGDDPSVIDPGDQSKTGDGLVHIDDSTGDGLVDTGSKTVEDEDN